MEDNFLDSLILYILREPTTKFITESIIDKFWDSKQRWDPFIGDWVEMY